MVTKEMWEGCFYDNELTARYLRFAHGFTRVRVRSTTYYQCPSGLNMSSVSGI